PVLRTLIVAGEECIFAIEHDRTNVSFDYVGIELDAAVIKETSEPVPMVQGVADGIGDQGLGRDARELLLEPRPELEHERLALLLAHGAAVAGALSPDRLLDHIELRDTFERLAGDRCVALL